MYVRHLAWLHAVPEGSKKSRLASYQELDENSSFLQFPDVSGAEYLVGLLNEAGLAGSNGMGATPLSWSEIESWLRCTGLDLSVWEVTTIRELSEHYVAELSQASEKNRAAPFVYIDPLKIDREKVSDKLLSALRSLKRTPHNTEQESQPNEANDEK